MMVQDQFSGNIHEVPDELCELGEVYDGLGCPLTDCVFAIPSAGIPFSALRRVVSAPPLFESEWKACKTFTNPQAGVRRVTSSGAAPYQCRRP